MLRVAAVTEVGGVVGGSYTPELPVPGVASAVSSRGGGKVVVRLDANVFDTVRLLPEVAASP